MTQMLPLLRWLWQAWRGNRLQALLNASLSVAGVAVSLAQVWAVQRAVDVAAGHIPGSIYRAVAVMGALVLADFAISISSVWVRNLLGIRAQNRMQQQMLARILRSEWSGRERRHSGDVINRLEGDVAQVVGFLTETLPSMLGVVLLFAGAFCYLFSMDRTLALVTVAILPLFIAMSRVYMRRMRRLTRSVRDSDSQVQSLLQETVQHRTLIKTMESDTMAVGRLEDTQSLLRHRVVRRTAFSVLSSLTLNFGFALSYLVAFLWAAVRMAAHTLSFGGMTAFLQLVNKIQQPARNLTRMAPACVAAFTAAERLMELEEDPEEEQGEPIPLTPPCGVRLRDVAYAYPGGQGEVLRHLSCDFRPATCTAILGTTGAGKTTLLRMMLALIRPSQGTATIYDDTREETLSPRTRCNFVYVPQGNTLMSGTVRQNLLLARPDATDTQMKEALTRACAEFVFSLPQGLDTPTAETGGGLSEGQAQRIAIARALLRPGSVMLLDEATSALDPDTERRLLHNILSSHTHTVIFITHRPAVVDYADQVVRL